MDRDVGDDDAALVAAARAGDPASAHAAFEALVRRHQQRVRAQLRRLAWPDAALADELAQDCFVQAWRSLGAFRGKARFSTWLHRIALSRWLMQRRRGALAMVPDEGAAQAAAAHDDPDAALRIDVQRAVARLPTAERIAVVHCLQLEMSHDEAAQVLGLPLGTVKSQVARGKARLREWLAEWHPER